jgi:hypothetical protein
MLSHHSSTPDISRVTAPGRVGASIKAAARPLLVGILTPPNERYGNYR